MPSFVVPPRSSRRLVISSSFAQPSCAIIICYQHRAFESSLAAKLAPCILVKLVMSGVALHHCSTISLLEACATLFDADSGPSKPIAHPWSHAILLCRMLLGHRAPRTALRMCGCCIAAAATHCHAGHHRLAIACRTRPLSASRSAADSQPIRRTSWSQAAPLCACRSVIAPSCRTSHLLPLVASPRYHRLATAHRTRPYYAARRTRPQPHAASRTPHAAQLSRIMGTSVCAMPRSVRYAIVASARRRVLCIAWSVRYAHGPLPERMHTINTSRILVGRIPDTSGRDARVSLRTYGSVYA